MNSEDCNTLMKETEDDTDRKTLCSCTGRIDIITVTILKLNYIFTAIPMKIPKESSTELDQIILKFEMETQKTLNCPSNLDKE